MIDHDAIHSDKFYECAGCKSIVYGEYLDWFSDEPELIICPVCDNRCEFIDVNDEVKSILDKRIPTNDEVDDYLEMDAVNE